MSLHEYTIDKAGPGRQFTKEEYIARHAKLFARHIEAERMRRLSWLQPHGHLLTESRHHLEYDFGLTRQQIESIEASAQQQS